MTQTEREQLLSEIQRLEAAVSRLNREKEELLAWIKRWSESSKK